MKGQILDVHPEGGGTFRACVLDGANNQGLIYVINLDTGGRVYCAKYECDAPIIENIFEA
jgi:hypothetical protein